MVNTDEKTKHRKAAIKAWQTIRAKKRQKAATSSEKITKFINPEVIERIRHPELVKSIETEEVIWKGNRIVVPFDKTPADIACGKFWEIRWAYGCPLNCSYCYLRGTMRGRMKPQYVRTELVLQALDEAFEKIKRPSIFNTGELADSLMNPQLMLPIIDKFEEQENHQVYLLSKFGTSNVDFLTSKLRKQVICGWSINTPMVAKKWEKTAAFPQDRIEAASLVKKVGYDTRIRIDPIFPINNWQIHYGELINAILDKFTPDRIILGTPRGLWKTIKYAREANADMEWIRFFVEDTSWGKKIAFDQRVQIYEFFYDKLESCGYPKSKISLCKETTDMWKTLNLKPFPKVCNCYGAK